MKAHLLVSGVLSFGCTRLDLMVVIKMWYVLQVVVGVEIEILVGMGWFTIDGDLCAVIIIDMNGGIQKGE